MRHAAALAVLIITPSVCGGADLSTIPANTWISINPIIVQPADVAEHGHWINAGWNKLVYDPDAKRVLFYDRWYDTKHGGYTIYGNCLFSFDPTSAQLMTR